jgi:ferredoxin-NADP reductase
MATWQVGTLITSRMVADDVKSLTFFVPGWIKHQAGQHYDIRLTAENGYQAERSYSVASSPEQEGELEFGVQLLEGGEVSPYLFQMKPGDKVELRGPIGGHFVWSTQAPGPLILIGGGSGMVPLMCMLRHHMAHIREDESRPIVFLISARTLSHVLYKEELTSYSKLNEQLNIVTTLTEQSPPGWPGYNRRIDKQLLEDVLGGYKEKSASVFVCGPTPFVEVAETMPSKVAEKTILQTFMSEGVSLGAILVAAIVNMVIGGIWYSPAAFGKAWMRLTGMSMDDGHKKGRARAMAWQFVATLVMAFVLAAFIDSMGARSAAEGVQIGFMVWLGFVATVGIGQQIFERRPHQLFWINSGFHLVGLMVMGAILAMWS